MFSEPPSRPMTFICQQPSLLIPNNLPRWRRRAGRREAECWARGRRVVAGEKINYKEYQQEIGRSPLFCIRASSVTKGIVFSSRGLFDSPHVWASFCFFCCLLLLLLLISPSCCFTLQDGGKNKQMEEGGIERQREEGCRSSN